MNLLVCSPKLTAIWMTPDSAQELVESTQPITGRIRGRAQRRRHTFSVGSWTFGLRRIPTKKRPTVALMQRESNVSVPPGVLPARGCHILLACVQAIGQANPRRTYRDQDNTHGAGSFSGRDHARQRRTRRRVPHRNLAKWPTRRPLY